MGSEKAGGAGVRDVTGCGSVKTWIGMSCEHLFHLGRVDVEFVGEFAVGN